MVTGKVLGPFHCLALKIVLSRIERKLKLNQVSVEEAAEEFYGFFVKNEAILAKDSERIFR
jgi:hypothetical protein